MTFFAIPDYLTPSEFKQLAFIQSVLHPCAEERLRTKGEHAISGARTQAHGRDRDGRGDESEGARAPDHERARTS